MINLVLQSFGRENEYKRAILTVLSYFAYTSLPVDQSRVILFTDKPEYFSEYLKGLPVDFVLLTEAKIEKMRGKIDFLHRMKIAMIEEAFVMVEGNLFYADSDTFFIADPSPIAVKAGPGTSFMHLKEYEFESLRDMELPAGKPFVDFLNFIESKQFSLENGTLLTVTSKHTSWNAGVMVFHNSHKRFLSDVFALTDQFYPATLNHASEQYAFSIILQTRTDLKPCDDVIYHYWYRVKKEIIDLFLKENLTDNLAKLPLDQKLSKVINWIEKLPAFFENHPLMLKDNAVQAFNRNDYKAGYKWASKAMLKMKFNDIQFIKDVLYHSKRNLKPNL